MSGQPPLSRPLTLAFIPGELLVDRVQWTDPNLGGAPDRPRLLVAIEQDDVAADDRRRFKVRTELANQSRRRALDPGYRQISEFARHFRAGAECHVPRA